MNEQMSVSTKTVVKITLIVLVTIVAFTILLYIVGGLMCAGAGLLVRQNVENRLDKARKEQTKEQIRQIGLAVKLFKLDTGFYPETQQGLSALVEPPRTSGILTRYYSGGYLEGRKVPLDQWGNEFIYVGPDQLAIGDLFKITSTGPDGKWGNDDDISMFGYEITKEANKP